ncbi:MAG: choice-of-anchor Q domain-containing protein [Pseudomonadota bacterium]|jgi:hypothetical protein
MNITRVMVTAIFGLAVSFSAAQAQSVDFYVQPVTPGPVQGIPLSVVTLQAAKPAGPAAAAHVAPGGPKLPHSGQVGAGPPSPTAVNEARNAAGEPIVVSVQAAPTAPWKSLQQLLDSGQVKGGDRIFLMDGYHGPLVVRNMNFNSPVLIAASPGATAQADSILVANSRNIIFRDLKVWPTSTTSTSAIVRSYPDTSDLAFVNLDVRGGPDAGNYMSWSLAEWRDGLRTGMLIQGARQTITGTRVTAVQHGILATGDDDLLDGNIIDGFAGDGMRALGDRSIVRKNRVQNCIDIQDKQHRDGFQTYSIGSDGKVGTGTQYGLVVEGNKIFEWTSPVANPLRCRLQGISMFDGMYDNFRIENNVVVVSAYHGLTVAGALNSVIRQNTVVNPSGQPARNPWIRIAYHKNGTPPRNTEVVNNLASYIVVPDNASLGIRAANNVIAGAASTEFVDFANENLALSAASSAIDKGDPARMTASDILDVKRFRGRGPDVGAYESR